MQDPELLFLVKCRDRQDNLYVVTDTVELTDTTVLCDNRSVNVWGSCFLPFDTFFKVHGCPEVGWEHKEPSQPSLTSQGLCILLGPVFGGAMNGSAFPTSHVLRNPDS